MKTRCVFAAGLLAFAFLNSVAAQPSGTEYSYVKIDPPPPPNDLKFSFEGRWESFPNSRQCVIVWHPKILPADCTQYQVVDKELVDYAVLRKTVDDVQTQLTSYVDTKVLERVEKILSDGSVGYAICKLMKSGGVDCEKVADPHVFDLVRGQLLGDVEKRLKEIDDRLKKLEAQK